MFIFLIIMIMAHSTDTYICRGVDANFSCERYLGGDPNTYFYDTQNRLEGVISTHELDGFDLANPYYSDEQDTIYAPNYSPFIAPDQVPQVFLDPNWSNPDVDDDGIPWAR